MATAPSSHAAFQFFRPAKRRLTCECLNRRRSPLQPVPSSQRNVSNATPHFSEMEVEGKPRPRWSYTPPAMAAPVRSRLRPEGVTPLKINSDPQKLDQVYIRFLGKDGDKMLKEETKWLAVTHKSFDHGRRGFNDRLSFLGSLDFPLLHLTDPSNQFSRRRQENSRPSDDFGPPYSIYIVKIPKRYEGPIWPAAFPTSGTGRH
jgi:hypothetical protein